MPPCGGGVRGHGKRASGALVGWPRAAHRPGRDRGGGSRSARRGKVRPRPFPDGRHAGAAEEPRRRSGRMGGSGRRHGGGAAPEAGHPGSAGLVRGGDRRENPRPSGIWHDGLPRHRRVRRRSASAYSEADTLLYPSLAEGFGLPPHEALDHGLLPICADLPSLRAGLGDAAVYLDPRDVYSWEETIRKRISGKLDGPRARSAKRPGWQDHFDGSPQHWLSCGIEQKGHE
jgi:hypothetical protein